MLRCVARRSCLSRATKQPFPIRTVATQAELLWKRSDPSQTAITAFAEAASRRAGKDLSSWPALHAWSVTDTAAFWGLCAEFCGVKWFTQPQEGREYAAPPSGGMRGASWFRDGRLNLAENLMPAPTDREALVSIVEGPAGAPVTRRITGRALHIEVARCAAALRAAGIRPGDRVAGVLVNASEALSCMLATAAVGGVWSSCSPDFGAAGVIDRLGQIAPRVVFFSAAYRYNGKRHNPSKSIAPVMEKMPPDCLAVIVPDPADENPEASARLTVLPRPMAGNPRAAMAYEEFLATGGVPADSATLPSIDFDPGEFARPAFIMFTSGTTGLPKCMVHGAGGTLLNIKKELMLHSDVKDRSRLLFYTTTGWMMWNWMAVTLSVPGATLVTYDGSPAWPRTDALWQLAEEEKLTHLGLSPKYIAACMAAGVSPRSEGLGLPHLRTVLSTGSPLLPEHFSWVYSEVKRDVHLASVSGGTDILGCFMLGNPNLPVHAGEIQCCGLGMDVAAYDDAEKRAVTGRKAELVCRTPFPSMPVKFLNDPDGAKYDAAYFSDPAAADVTSGGSGSGSGNGSGGPAGSAGGGGGMWRHGDFIEITETGIVVHGRSDSTLNPGGVRIGTAELYRQIHNFPEVADSVAVGWRVDGDVEVALFVKMAAGAAPLTDELAKRIRTAVRASLTPRHVPKHIVEVSDIPYTRSGKKVEVAVTKALHGEPVTNTSALANAECLEEFTQAGRKLKAKEAALPAPSS